MKHLITAFFIAATLSAGAQTGAYDEQARAYVRKYKDWAIEEQQRTGVPAAITLAQGIHETQAGQSELATEANNHFGIKCKKTWTGETYSHTDDAPDECFRKYAKAYDSYKDHSDYLRQTPRYVHCFEQDVTDYAGWARELKAAGYATNPKYASKLVHIVEDFHLQDYTYEAMKGPQPQGEGLGRVTETVPVNERAAENPRDVTIERRAPETQREIVREEARDAAPVPVDEAVAETEEYTEPTPVYGQITMRNNLKGFYAHKGDVLLEQAIKYNMRYAKILELNDLPDAPLEADMFVYTEKKRSMGLRRAHMVKSDETMLLIAQSEGVQLKQLRMMNGLTEGEELAQDAMLNLQTISTTRPALREHNGKAAATYRQPMNSYRESETVATGHTVRRDAEQAEAMIPREAEVPKVVSRTKASVPERRVEEIPTEALPMPVSKPVAAPKPQPEPRRTPPPPAPPKQKTYTIADEMAVGEETSKYSPRYQSQNAAPAVNTSETSVQELAKEEPQDDFSRLKARLDKAVYAPAKPSSAGPQSKQSGTKAAEKPVPVAEITPSADDASPAYHYVKTGETAYGIAKQNHISMKQLMEWNNLNFEAIKVGQKLRVK